MVSALRRHADLSGIAAQSTRTRVRRWSIVNRDEVVKVLAAQPYETDVQVNVGGFYVDVARVDFDERRHAIVVELMAEDAEQAMRHFVWAGPLEPDADGLEQRLFGGCPVDLGCVVVFVVRGQSADQRH